MTLTLSWFLRHSGEALEQVDRGDLVLRRRDGDDLHLTTSERAAALRDGIRLLSRLLVETLQSDDGRSAILRSVPRAAGWSVFLGEDERDHFVEEMAAVMAAAADLSTPAAIARVLERWRDLARTRADQGQTASTRAERPVAIPVDFDAVNSKKPSGIVELPTHIRWSGEPRQYDLSDPVQLRRVYEQVLREGTEHDIRRFIDPEVLLEQWEALVLPTRVRRAWAAWFRDRKGIDLPC